MVMSKRETTLRQLIYHAVKEVTKEEGLLRSEIHTLVEHILNNSVLELTTERLHLTEGNFFGVGENNKDRRLTVPRFISFSFKKQSLFDMLNKQGRTWELRTYSDFDDLERALTCELDEQLIAIVDGEIVEYQKVGHNTWGWEIIWGCDAYIVTYVSEDMEQKEILRSKLQLQNRILQLVAEEAEGIQAYNLLSGEKIDFLVRKDIYTTKLTKTADGLWFTWCNDMREDDEAEELMF
jgi:hypothetical protein